MKWRVLLALVVVTTVAVGSFFVVTATAIRDRDVTVELLQLKNEAGSQGLRLSEAGTRWADVRLVRADSSHAVNVYTKDGKLLSSIGRTGSLPQLAGQAVSNQTASGREGDLLIAAHAIRVHDAVVGVVTVTEPVSVRTGRTSRTLVLLGLFAALLVAASAGLGWQLTRSITSRFEQIHSAALRIGDGDFAHRVPPTGLPEFDRVGNALSRTAERLETMVKRERAFSAEASHQMRTPIASLRVALEAELLDPRADRTLVLQEGLITLDRLAATVESLLALRRGAPTDRDALDSRRLLTEALERWRQPFQQRRRSIRLLTVEELPVEIKVSGTALAHVLDVLIDNALQHGRGTVDIRGVRRERGYSILVADQGSIAEPNDLFLARGQARRAGGIGLALARTLAAAEGASLRLLSGSPTTFEVLLTTTSATPLPRPE